MRRVRIDWMSVAIGAACGALAVKWYVEAHKVELVRDAFAKSVKDAVNPGAK